MPSPDLRRPVLLALAVLTAVLVPFAVPALAEGPPASTALRITAPSSVPAGTAADVWIRLVRTANGGEEGAGGKSVLIQRQSASGWYQVAAFTTRTDGLAHGPVTVGSTGRYRAVFRGDTTHAAATSGEIAINAVSNLGDRAVAEARRHDGAPYLYGAAGPTRFDCSGLTMYVYGRLGKKLPHGSGAQASVTRRISAASKRPGDLIFTYHGGTIGHVGIYAGGSMIWASVQSGDTVRLQSFAGRTYTVGRIA